MWFSRAGPFECGVNCKKARAKIDARAIDSRPPTSQYSTRSVRLRRINADESARLANAVVSPKFLGAMEAFNAKRNPNVSYFFSFAKRTLPLWQPAPIEPAYKD